MFLIYLMRRSFQIQLDLVLRFLKTMEGQTELCQRVLRQVTVDFRCFRHCVRIYMTAVIPLCVLGITTNLTWQYMLHATDAKPSESLTTQKYINIMIWLEISMFICLGAVAVGGIDAKHIWEKFQLSIYCLQSSHQQSHWNYLIRYLKHVEERTAAVSFSMILSVVGFYMAVQFGKQDVIYWKHNDDTIKTIIKVLQTGTLKTYWNIFTVIFSIQCKKKFSVIIKTLLPSFWLVYACSSRLMLSYMYYTFNILWGD